MFQPVVRLLLPFAVPAKDRTRAFTKDMEMAAIFYLTESEREKGEQLVLKKPVEKIAFIAETCYPMWLVPWRKRTLLFDGFGVTGHKVHYDIVPDVEAFENDIQASAETHEAYVAALSNNLNYFQTFSDRDDKTVEGLITDSDFVRDVALYIREAKESEKSLGERAFLSASINQSAISISLEELSNLRTSVEEDIRSLRRSMKMLSTTTREQAKVISREIRETGKKFDERIATVKPTVRKKLQEIQKRIDMDITKLSKKYERQIRVLLRDRIRLEKEQHHLTVQVERCETEMKSSRLRRDEGRELQWRQRQKEMRRKLPTLKRGIERINREIRETETTKKLEISTTRSQYETKTEEAQRSLRKLEASREASIRMKEQEMKSLEDMTTEIIDQLNGMVKQKKAALEEIDGVGMPERHKNIMLVYVPLYLIAYEAKQKRRYLVCPPSFVESMGILTRFKGAFGMTKMKSFLQHRSKPLTSFLNQLVILLEEDPVFERETSDAGIQTNILRTKESRENIKKGLRELKEEGWISESEFRTISGIL